MTSLPVNFRFYRILKISFSINFIAQNDSPLNFRGVFKGDFDLRPLLVVDIHNFDPFVTPLTDIDATVKITYALNMTAGSMTFPNVQHTIFLQILDF